MGPSGQLLQNWHQMPHRSGILHDVIVRQYLARSAYITFYQETHLPGTCLLVLLYAAETWTWKLWKHSTFSVIVRCYGSGGKIDFGMHTFLFTRLPSVSDLICIWQSSCFLSCGHWPGCQHLPQLIRPWSCRSTSLSTDFPVPTGSAIPVVCTTASV